MQINKEFTGNETKQRIHHGHFTGAQRHYAFDFFFFCFPFNFVKKKKVSFSSDKNIHFDPHYIYIYKYIRMYGQMFTKDTSHSPCMYENEHGFK